MEEERIDIITLDAFRKERDGKPRAVLLHTLPESHFERQHIPGAKNACVYEVTFLDTVAALVPDKGQPIVAYGSRKASRDARAAAEKLIRAGYTRVEILAGGLAAWVAAGEPTEGTETGAIEDFETTPVLEQRSYRVVPEESRVEWSGRNPNGKHHGTIDLGSGELSLREGTIDGRFELDMTTIRNTDLAGDDLYKVLISHLESDDFFFVKRFPTARFTITEAIPASSPVLTLPNFEVRGILTLRGVCAEIDFPATVSLTSDGGIAADAHFDIDRTRWNIIYGSSRFFDHLGMHLVFDILTIDLRIVAR